MTPPVGTEHLESLHRPGGVAVWQSQIQQFFQHDWEKLRTLILRMEEQSWGQGSEKSATMQVDVDAVMEAFSRPSQPMMAIPGRSATPEPAAAVPPVERNRLVDLAESIEQKLRAANSRVREE